VASLSLSPPLVLVAVEKKAHSHAFLQESRCFAINILAREQGWTHLCLPAVYEAKHPFPMRTRVVRKSTGKIWADPRQDGEVLWPAKFPRRALQRIAKDEAMTSHVAAGQLQQRPSAREGGMFKREWFAHTLPVPDRFAFIAAKRLQLVRAWDLAWTEPEHGKQPDDTVGLLMGYDSESTVCYILDVVRGRWSPAQVEREVQAIAAIDGYECVIRIPQDPSSGKFVAYHMAKKLVGYQVTVEPESGSKAQRAVSFAAHCENRFVVLAQADWNTAFVEELCAFPNGANADQVDAAAAAFRAAVRRPQLSAVGA